MENTSNNQNLDIAAKNGNVSAASAQTSSQQTDNSAISGGTKDKLADFSTPGRSKQQNPVTPVQQSKSTQQIPQQPAQNIPSDAQSPSNPIPASVNSQNAVTTKANNPTQIPISDQTDELLTDKTYPEDLDTQWTSWKCLVCGYVYEGVKPLLKCPRCQNEDPDKFD